jgi:hypothetical protein
VTYVHPRVAIQGIHSKTRLSVQSAARTATTAKNVPTKRLILVAPCFMGPVFPENRTSVLSLVKALATPGAERQIPPKIRRLVTDARGVALTSIKMQTPDRPHDP